MSNLFIIELSYSMVSSNFIIAIFFTYIFFLNSVFA